MLTILELNSHIENKIIPSHSQPIDFQSFLESRKMACLLKRSVQLFLGGESPLRNPDDFEKGFLFSTPFASWSAITAFINALF